MAKLRVSLSMKNKPRAQGDYRATYSVLFLPVSVPVSTHIALITISTSSLIALFQLPLLLPWFNSLLLVSSHALAVGHDLVSQALSSPLYSTLHSLGQSFVSPQMHCPLSHYILALYFWLLLSRPILFSYFLPRPSFFCRCSVSYSLAPISFAALFFISLAPFLWVTFCLTPVFFMLLFCLLRFRPILLASCLSRPSGFCSLLSLTILSRLGFFLSSLFYSLAPFFWVNIYLAPVFFLSSLSYSLTPFFWLNIYLAPVFFLSSLSYSLAPFFWLNIYLVPVFFLFSLLQSRPIGPILLAT